MSQNRHDFLIHSTHGYYSLARMRAPNSQRKEFLKRWLKGLKIYTDTKKEMSILERKKAIKLSADVAMASTRASTTYWSRALMANASKNDKILVQHILGSPSCSRDQDTRSSPMKKSPSSILRIRSKKILRKSCAAQRLKARVAGASSIARRLIKKRTKVLKNLVPGGEFMDDISLVRETLDYIVSLSFQVDIMRRFANVTNGT